MGPKAADERPLVSRDRRRPLPVRVSPVTRVAALVCQNRMVRSRCRTDVSGKAHLNGVHTRLGPWRSEKAPGGPAAVRNRLFAIIALCIELGPGSAMAGLTSRVSVRSGGGQADGSSTLGSMTPDGRFVAFMSAAPNLVPGDSNGREDVFVHDRTTGVTERVSVASDGSELQSYYYPAVLPPAISADGTVVAFLSRARSLVAGTKPCRIYPDCSHVFVHDRTTGVTEAIDVASDGTPADDGTFDGPTLSFDGKLVAFDTYATNLVSEPTLPETWESVFLHDRGTGLTTRVSVASDGTPGTCYNLSPGMSPDGRFVAFASCADNLVAADTNGRYDVFVRDRTLGTTTRVSVTSDGSEASGAAYPGFGGRTTVSTDGRLVAFISSDSNLVRADTNQSSDVFVHDRDQTRGT